jgi:hypothetical protein
MASDYMTKIPARAEISARFGLPGLKFQPGLKLSQAACNRNHLNGLILRVYFVFKYFTYNHSLTQVK